MSYYLCLCMHFKYRYKYLIYIIYNLYMSIKARKIEDNDLGRG